MRLSPVVQHLVLLGYLPVLRTHLAGLLPLPVDSTGLLAIHAPSQTAAALYPSEQREAASVEPAGKHRRTSLLMAG